jgi:hypothetical protein
MPLMTTWKYVHELRVGDSTGHGIIAKIANFPYPDGNTKTTITYHSGMRQSFWRERQEMIWVHNEIDTSEDY